MTNIIDGTLTGLAVITAILIAFSPSIFRDIFEPIFEPIFELITKPPAADPHPTDLCECGHPRSVHADHYEYTQCFLLNCGCIEFKLSEE